MKDLITSATLQAGSQIMPAKTAMQKQRDATCTSLQNKKEADQR